MWGPVAALAVAVGIAGVSLSHHKTAAYINEAPPEERQHVAELAPIEDISHRGDAGGVGEETLDTYDVAYIAGLRSMEMDLQVTRDGEVILLHDATVDRTTSGTGAVKDLTLSKIMTFTVKWTDGLKIATWPEVVAWAKSHPDVHLYPEIKDYRTIDDIKTMLDPVVAAGIQDRTTFASFKYEPLKIIREEGFSGEIMQYIGNQPTTNFDDVAKRVHALGGRLAMGIQSTTINSYPEDVEIARRHGIDVVAWVVDTPEEARLLLPLGVRRFISNRYLKIPEDPSSPGRLLFPAENSNANL